MAEDKKKKKKKEKEGSVGEALQKLGTEKVTKVGGEFQAPEQAAAERQQRYSIKGKQLTKPEYEAAKGLMGFERGKGGPITPAVEEAIYEPTPEKLQAEVLERERIKREGEVVEEEPLPIEEQPAVIEPIMEEELEERGIFQKLNQAYEWVDRVGGLIPKETYEEMQTDVIAGTLPITPVGGLGAVKAGKAALSTTKATTGIRATKLWSGMLKVLKSDITKKIGKWGAVGYALWSERTMSSIDASLSQVRESLTLPVQMAAVNPARIQDSFDMITSFEEDINEYESMLKAREGYALTAKLTGRTLPIYQRIKKLRLAVDVSRNQIAKIEIEKRVYTDEETALLLNEINTILDKMEKPVKFLGIF